MGDDGLSQKLSFELQAGLRRDRRLRLAAANDKESIVIETDSNVDSDVLDGREVAIVTAYVFLADEERPRPVVRSCWTGDMETCARAIIRLARIRALSPNFIRNRH